MFPTHVGMNRLARAPGAAAGSVPHARGDEPLSAEYEAERARVFPTHVGMNRQVTPPAAAAPRVPHARGDEPAGWWGDVSITECSPRTWG